MRVAVKGFGEVQAFGAIKEPKPKGTPKGPGQKTPTATAETAAKATRCRESRRGFDAIVGVPKPSSLATDPKE